MLSAYLLGGFGHDAKGRNGVGKAVAVAAKSWVVGIPVIISPISNLTREWNVHISSILGQHRFSSYNFGIVIFMNILTNLLKQTGIHSIAVNEGHLLLACNWLLLPYISTLLISYQCTCSTWLPHSSPCQLHYDLHLSLHLCAH